MSISQYNFARVAVAVAGVPVTDWMDGDDVIKITRGAESVNVLTGADGRSIASANLNRSAIVEFRLKPTSPSQAQLTALELTYRNAVRAVPFSFGLLDLQNGTGLFAAETIVLTPPTEINYGDNATQRLWRLFCGEMSATTIGAIN